MTEAEQKIDVIRVCPPIPTRAFDWCATFDGYEPGDPVGWGVSKQAAILDLMGQL